MKLKRDEDFDIIDLANTISLEELGKLININADRISVHFGVNKVQFDSIVYDTAMNGESCDLHRVIRTG
jgi:translation elongation factor EF-1beta